MYKKRIVVFLDILGFSAITNKCIKDKVEYKKLKELLEYISKAFPKYFHRDKEYKVTTFSDSIIMSCPFDKPSEVFYTLYFLQLEIPRFIAYGYLVRGGVTIGLATHTDNIVFGPAINKSYKLESEIAIYPRIIVDEELIEIGKKHRNGINTENREKEYIESLLDQDDDGLYYIDYFSAFLGNCDSEADEMAYINQLRNIILGNLKIEDIKVRVKYMWLKKKFNKMIKALERDDFIN